MHRTLRPGSPCTKDSSCLGVGTERNRVHAAWVLARPRHCSETAAVGSTALKHDVIRKPAVHIQRIETPPSAEDRHRAASTGTENLVKFGLPAWYNTYNGQTNRRAQSTHTRSTTAGVVNTLYTVRKIRLFTTVIS